MRPFFEQLRGMQVPPEQLAGSVALAELGEHFHQGDDAAADNVVALTASGRSENPGAAELCKKVKASRNLLDRASRAALQVVSPGEVLHAFSLFVT